MITTSLREANPFLAAGCLACCALACASPSPIEPDAGDAAGCVRTGTDGGACVAQCQTPTECSGDAIEPGAGSHPVLVSTLSIGSRTRGMDLNGDGAIDNALSALGPLFYSALETAFTDASIIIPIEFFDLPELQADACVKFGVYQGRYVYDTDGDGHNTVYAEGDCDDHDPDRYPGAVEVLGNAVDDDCDGLADEDDTGGVTAPSSDGDGDGVTILDGDCDDTNPDVRGPDVPEICADGLDNDCDGAADHGIDDSGRPECSPYDDSTDSVEVLESSFDADGRARITYTNGTLATVDGAIRLAAGPSTFSLSVPAALLGGSISFALSCARLEATVEERTDGIQLTDGLIGGLVDARGADDVRGIEFDAIGLTADDSLLDAAFANVLGDLLRLAVSESTELGRCRTPDIDVDGDGLESFCDSSPDDDTKRVDTCVDGDGTVIRDTVDSDGVVTEECSRALDEDGQPRFVDGISAALEFEAVPVELAPAENAPAP